MNLGQRIRELRAVKGWTTMQLGDAAQTSGPQISRIENGQRPRPDLEERIAKALGVTVADFYRPERTAEQPGSAVPLFDIALVGRDGQPSRYIGTELKTSDKAFAVTIETEAMLPLFKVGDHVVVDPAVKPAAGDIVLAFHHNQVVCRQYKLRGQDPVGSHVFELSPLNSDYASATSDRAPLLIVGTAVEHKRYLGRRV